jgi:hypothetical protein
MSADTPRFDQQRKAAATAVAGDVRACLRDYYGVPDKRLVSAEHGREGAYETGGDYRPTDFLDYAGVDWLVDARPAIVPVGERIRPNDPQRRDFSLRLENGCERPCESDRLPAGLQRGLAPRTLLFGWRSGDRLDRAWLLDCERLVEAVTFNEVAVDERPSGDGTVAGYITVGELADADCVLASWTEVPTSAE